MISPDKLSQELASLDVDKAVDYIVDGMLRKIYKTDPKTKDEKETNSKIEKMFTELYGMPITTIKPKKVNSILLMGPNGHGKSAAFKLAAEKVANGLGLELVLNPDDDFVATKEHFIFVDYACYTNENYSPKWVGVPHTKKVVMTEEGEQIEHMSKLINKRLAMSTRAGGALLLLDNFPNATPSVQNVGLSLIDDKRLQGLNIKNLYTGFTGNVSNNHTPRLSTAFLGKIEVYYTQDSLFNFINRTQQKYRDEIGTCAIECFLSINPDAFFQFPSTKGSGGYPSPRNWDNFLEEARWIATTHGDSGRNFLVKSNIKNKAVAYLGVETGLKLADYYQSLINGAEPIAKQMIQEGKFDEKTFKEKFKEGLSAENYDFGYQYSIALADYAVQMIVQDPKANFKTAIERFGQGIMPVNQHELSFAIDHLKSKLANQVDEMSTKFGTRRILTTEVKKQIVKYITENKDITTEQRQTLVDAFPVFIDGKVGGPK